MRSFASLAITGLLAACLGCAAVIAAAPATQPSTPAPAVSAPTTAPALSDVHLNQEEVDKLEQYWQQKVSPHKKALQEAAEAHYKVLSDLRREQQRLIDEADRIQRAIDKLEKEYQDMTTPRPEGQ